MVAAASIDRVVHVWSTQAPHKILHRLDGHTETVYCVAFSADGNRLVSGGLDKTIKASKRRRRRRCYCCCYRYGCCCTHGIAGCCRVFVAEYMSVGI